MKRARHASTYRANKLSPRRYANLVKGLNPAAFPVDLLATVPVKAVGVQPPRSWTRKEGCTKARNGKPHQHRRECERRLRQIAKRSAKA